MTTVTQDATAIRPSVGEFRRFGELGVAYEVIEITDEMTAAIRVLESGETLTYPITSILSDPAA